ncbi:ribonuclease domain-containing protein [Streptomyces avicenniae]|uniref:ribonuclease domain-containing protein n=1 Tax=Streptomyces avicenniae TaxID=500153 RepID=UPI00069AA615|nr:ribonuclease domain-containing protein [Streptomyces avicenniae]
MNLRARGVRIGALGALLSTFLLTGQTSATATPAPVPATTAATAGWTAADVGDICWTDLPSQAHDTLDLIARGGPYPYPQDGGTFHNREGLLPPQPTGYYAEYTVETPGSSTRGARRIVTGEEYEEDYYTADHYASFDLVDHSC